MAVIVSSAQNEEADLRAKGADIRPHRLRLNKEDLEEKFKDADDPLRLVFVCAMWMTGFDAPACSTLYLDKPMRNHTLMQTIARANRVFGDKVNGLIVDYIGIFRNLQQALAIYGTDSGGGIAQGDLPVEPKAALINQLRQALSEARSFCAALSMEQSPSSGGIDLDAIQAAEGFERIRLRDDAVNAILVNDSTRQKFLTHAYLINRLYRAVLPDPIAHEFNPTRSLLDVLAQQVRADSGDDDEIENEASGIAQAVRDIELRLDGSIEASYARWTIDGARPVDLRQIDFEAIQRRFKQGHQHIEIEQLRAMIRRSLDRLVPRNRSRMDFYDAFQKMIADYNAGATNAEARVCATGGLCEATQRRRTARHPRAIRRRAVGDPGHPHAAQPPTHQGRTRASEAPRARTPRHAESRTAGAGMAQPAADSRRRARRDSGSAREPAAEILRRRLPREVRGRVSARV